MPEILTKDKRDQLMGLGLFMLVGILCAIVGIYLLSRHTYLKNRCSEPVSAVVIDMKGHSTAGARKKVTYAPVFEYEYGGKKYTYTSDVSSDPPSFRRGDEVELMIDPDDPNVVFVTKDKSERWIIAAALAFGVIFTLFGGIGIKKMLSKTDQ